MFTTLLDGPAVTKETFRKFLNQERLSKTLSKEIHAIHGLGLKLRQSSYRYKKPLALRNGKCRKG